MFFKSAFTQNGSVKWDLSKKDIWCLTAIIASVCILLTYLIHTRLKPLKEIMSPFSHTIPYFYNLAALKGADHPKIEISPSHHYVDGGSGDILWSAKPFWCFTDGKNTHPMPIIGLYATNLPHSHAAPVLEATVDSLAINTAVMGPFWDSFRCRLDFWAYMASFVTEENNFIEVDWWARSSRERTRTHIIVEIIQQVYNQREVLTEIQHRFFCVPSVQLVRWSDIRPCLSCMLRSGSAHSFW